MVDHAIVIKSSKAFKTSSKQIYFGSCSVVGHGSLYCSPFRRLHQPESPDVSQPCWLAKTLKMSKWCENKEVVP